MAIKFGGEFEIKRTPEEAYDFLTDPQKFAPLLPDFQSMTQQDATHFTVRVNVGISYIKGAADMKMELTAAERPKRAQYKGQGSAAGGKVAMTAGLRPHSCGCWNQSGLAGRGPGLRRSGVGGRRAAGAARKKECPEVNRRFADSIRLSCKPQQGAPT